MKLPSDEQAAWSLIYPEFVPLYTAQVRQGIIFPIALLNESKSQGVGGLPHRLVASMTMRDVEIEGSLAGTFFSDGRQICGRKRN